MLRKVVSFLYRVLECPCTNKPVDIPQFFPLSGCLNYALYAYVWESLPFQWAFKRKRK